MTDKEKDEYIKLLEEKIKKDNSEKEILSDLDIKSLFKIQEEIVIGRNQSYEYLISENARLNEEISRLSRIIIQDSNYINYLINSKWWKMTFPLRKLSRTLRKNTYIKNFDYNFNINRDNEPEKIKDRVTVIIYANNTGMDLINQINNINKQRLVPNINILIITKNPTDKVTNNIKDKDVSVIDIKNSNLSDDEIYVQILPKITGEYVVVMEQNIIIKSHYWLYSALKPIIDNNTISTIFFKKDFSGEYQSIKNSTYYNELKKRMISFDDMDVLYLPENRDIIQYIPPVINQHASVIVKKKINNIMFRS